MVTSGGLEALSAVMKQHEGHVGVQAQACQAVAYLAAGHGDKRILEEKRSLKKL